MRWLQLLLLGVIAVFLLTACSSFAKQETAPQGPLPEAIRLPCPEPMMPDDNLPDTVMMALKKMYDLYGGCAARHYDAIIIFERREQESR